MHQCVHCKWHYYGFYIIFISVNILYQTSKKFKSFPDIVIWFTSLHFWTLNLRAYSLLLFKIYFFLLMNYCFWHNLEKMFQFTSQCQNNFYWFHHSSFSHHFTFASHLINLYSESSLCALINKFKGEKRSSFYIQPNKESIYFHLFYGKFPKYLLKLASQHQNNLYFNKFYKTIWLWEYIPALQFSSVAQLCPTFCHPMKCSTPGLPVHHQLPEFTQTHVHRVSDAIQPSHPLSSPSPPAPNSSQHQSLFQWVNSSHEVAKVLEFQL